MKNNKHKIDRKLVLLGIGLAVMFSFVVLVSALTSTQENELVQLENDLSSQGYDWIVNAQLNLKGDINL